MVWFVPLPQGAGADFAPAGAACFFRETHVIFPPDFTFQMKKNTQNFYKYVHFLVPLLFCKILFIHGSNALIKPNGGRARLRYPHRPVDNRKRVKPALQKDFSRKSLRKNVCFIHNLA
jgi:hypothetical protein